MNRNSADGFLLYVNEIHLFDFSTLTYNMLIYLFHNCLARSFSLQCSNIYESFIFYVSPYPREFIKSIEDTIFSPYPPYAWEVEIQVGDTGFGRLKDTEFDSPFLCFISSARFSDCDLKSSQYRFLSVDRRSCHGPMEEIKVKLQPQSAFVKQQMHVIR